MTKSVRQTRIFVPAVEPFDGATWCETTLGAIVTPLIGAHREVDWFWFSRYDISPREDSHDCDIAQIPESFMIDGRYRSLRLRYAIPTRLCDEFESHARALIERAGATVSDFRDYAWIIDLGGDRFVGGDRSPSRRKSRASLMAEYLDAVSRFTLDCVVGPTNDGRYAFEANDNDENPHGSSFESMHYLFCNVTDVPTFVLVLGNQLATHWMARPAGVEPYELQLKF